MCSESKDRVLATALQALADKTRLKILLMLEGKPRTVGEIVEFFELSQPTITRHLQTLLEAGLVTRAKKAQRVYYSLNASSINDFCVELIGCFPCCCVTVESTNEKPASKHFDKPEATSRKGARPTAKPRKKEGDKP